MDCPEPSCLGAACGVEPSEVPDPGLFRQVLDSLNDGVYFVDRSRRITFWSAGAERITGFRAEEVVGHKCADGILMHVNDTGRCMCRTTCPLARSMGDRQGAEALIYLHHKAGHRVPVNVRVSPMCDRDGQVIGAVEIFSDASARLAALERARELEAVALLDPLTGLGNRRYTQSFLEDRLAECHRYGWSFGVLFVDVDHFKPFNDRYGHEVGDLVLRNVAGSLSGSLRSFDFVGRWGGEEFLVLCPNTDLAQAEQVARRCRALVGTTEIPLPDGSSGCVTVSVGVTEARVGDTVQSLVARADRLMYDSKAAGRNRVTTG